MMNTPQAQADVASLSIADLDSIPSGDAAWRRSWVERIAHLGSWELDLASGRVTCSDEAHRILGMPRERFDGSLESFLATVHAEDRPMMARLMDEAAGKGAAFNIDHRVVMPGGGQRIVNQHAEVVAAESGQPAKVLGAILDITDRKRVEQQLRASEEQTRMIIDSALDAVVLMDDKGIITAWNPQAEAMFGWPRREAVGRPLAETIFSPEHREAHASGLRRMLSTGQRRLMGRRIELPALHRDGGELTIELSMSPLRMHEATIFSAFIRDISERKRHEEALRASNETQKLLLSELNHRVRNNLAGLISLIDMSASSASDIRSLASTVSSRVHSMAAVHAMLSHSNWGAVSLEEMISKLMPHGRRGKVETGGPEVLVPAQQCTALGMVIGELMANSLKYGALSIASGVIEIAWQAREPDDASLARLDMTWRERGGPPIEHEPQPHLGTSLVRGFVRSDLRGEVTLAYPTDGASHRLVMNLDYSHYPVNVGGK